MKYNTKQFIPFSNGTEAEMWIVRNCDKCKLLNCTAKRRIQEGFITGEMPLKRAEWVGVDGGRLKSKCDKFTTEKPERKQKDMSDKFQYNMF